MASWWTLGLAFFTAVVVVEARPTSSSSDGCDWAGSGFDHPNQERGVQPVYLRCSQGTVIWKWPHGALRIVLRLGSAGREFRGCIRAISPTWQSGRIYFEGQRQLHLLFAANDGRPADLPRCFTSKKGQAALYVEADATRSVKDDQANFIYDLQPFKASKDPLEECRPCSEDELLHNFCVSDFVAKGLITSVIDNHELDRSEINIKVHRVIREAPSTPVFRQSNTRYGDDDVDGRQETFTTLHVPSKCQVRQGEGDFLFMGRLKLGNPVLKCAPRLSDWDRLREEATRTGRTQCTLE